MNYFGNGFSEQHQYLQTIIRKEAKIEEAKQCFLSLHAMLHHSRVSNMAVHEVDALLDDLKREEYTIMPGKQDETIAWVLWHITRIEDITMNLLLARTEQVYDAHWKANIHAGVDDTGNAMSDEEIIALSKQLDIGQLLAYRDAVGKRTREVVSSLSAKDMKRKVASVDLDRVLAQGGVSEQESAIWLLAFWGKKDVAGLLLMPATRHEVLHLNACAKWKQSIRKKKNI